MYQTTNQPANYVDQHWHIYQKWNARLFEEMYSAYRKGRMENDPSGNWYQGEIGFFDNYIIPLAKKLRECGVFGVASGKERKGGAGFYQPIYR